MKYTDPVQDQLAAADCDEQPFFEHHGAEFEYQGNPGNAVEFGRPFPTHPDSDSIMRMNILQTKVLEAVAQLR